MTVTAADDLDHEWLTTCMHEAGHATAYVVHGQPFKAVKVFGGSRRARLRVTETYGGQVDPLPHLVRVYAGPVAEGLYRAAGALRSFCRTTWTWGQTAGRTTRAGPPRCASSSGSPRAPTCAR